ncbi:unnamed protein product [marine sediment metagenome]|uniref:Uncharacterized protein n=1 Tax=marine sediment metagenome TaxID=412755 RepID=X1QYT6_9ZZZZ
MKIDFNYQFKTLDGGVIPERPDEEIVDKDGKKTTKKHPPFTLRKVCENVLLLPDMDKDGEPKEMNGEEKAKRYDLAKRIYTGPSLVDLQAEEIALLKKLIGRHYPTLTSGQAWEILDPHGATEKETKPQEGAEPQGTSEKKGNKDN